MNNIIANPVGKKNQKKVECFMPKDFGEIVGGFSPPTNQFLLRGSLFLLQQRGRQLRHQPVLVLHFLCPA